MSSEAPHHNSLVSIAYDEKRKEIATLAIELKALKTSISVTTTWRLAVTGMNKFQIVLPDIRESDQVGKGNQKQN
jgi:hypothetical protein